MRKKISVSYTHLDVYKRQVLSASNLDTVPRISVLDLYEFKYLARPAQMAMAELLSLIHI